MKTLKTLMVAWLFASACTATFARSADNTVVQAHKTCFDDLPNEIIVLILDNVSMKDLKLLACVNTQLRSCVLDWSLLKKFCYKPSLDCSDLNRGLTTAVIAGFVAAVNVFLGKHANACFIENGHSLLYIALEHGHEGVAQTLIDNGADVNAEEPFAQPLLHGFVRNENTRAVALLIKLGADLNLKNNIDLTPLHEAATIDNHAAAKLLIDAGAIVDALDSTNQTPLHKAARYNSREVATILIAHNASALLRNSSRLFFGKRPSDLAIDAKYYTLAEFLNQAASTQIARQYEEARAKHGFFGAVLQILKFLLLQ